MTTPKHTLLKSVLIIDFHTCTQITQTLNQFNWKDEALFTVDIDANCCKQAKSIIEKDHSSEIQSVGINAFSSMTTNKDQRQSNSLFC